MAEVLLSSDELTVLGGPAQISVDVDFGPQGDRGSLILYGPGKPTTVTLPETPQVYDTYINLLPSDDEYMFIYHYIAGDGGTLTWVKMFKLIANTYSENTQRSFNEGEIQVNIPLAAIVPADQLGDYTAADFNIQCNVLNTNPTSVGVTVSEIAIVGDLVSLPITIKAVEFSGGEWLDLAGTKTVHLFITVV